MKKFLLILAILMFALQTQAMDKQFGVGLGGGNYVSGISAKYNLGKGTALQGILGARGGEGFGIGVDFVIEMPPSLLKNKDINITWYAGFGGTWTHIDYGYHSNDYSLDVFGINGVVGVSFMLQVIPLEIAIEWKPAFFLGVDHDWYDRKGLYLIDFGGAIRYYF